LTSKNERERERESDKGTEEGKPSKIKTKGIIGAKQAFDLLGTGSIAFSSRAILDAGPT